MSDMKILKEYHISNLTNRMMCKKTKSNFKLQLNLKACTRKVCKTVHPKGITALMTIAQSGVHKKKLIYKVSAQYVKEYGTEVREIVYFQHSNSEKGKTPTKSDTNIDDI